MRNFLLIIFISVAFLNDFDQLYFGSDDALDIMTWNIEWFPKNGNTTVGNVYEIIQALDMDVIAMQELDDTDSFDQMIMQLNEYDGYYESSWFAGLAYIYKTDVVEINNIYEIYTTSPYWNAFPRSPMVMDMDFMGENYIIINNHYKCCGDEYLNLNDDGDEENRRYMANMLLKEYIENFFPNKNVILLGDLNDNLSDSQNNNVFQMFLDDSDNYLFADYDIAFSSNTNWSYPSWPSHLDHILITDELFDVLDNVETIKIDYFMDGGFSDYDYNISDHRPVAIKISSNNNYVVGDINQDSLINVLDIVLVIDIILNGGNQFNILADLNEDGIINVIDVVQLVNEIIN